MNEKNDCTHIKNGWCRAIVLAKIKEWELAGIKCYVSYNYIVLSFYTGISNLLHGFTLIFEE